MLNAMGDLLLTHWGWLALALLLAGAEILAPGIFMIWLAAAALLTGIATWALALGWQVQLALFAALAIVSILVGRGYLRQHPIASDDRALNRRGDRLIGQTVTVVEPIRGGKGRVQIADSPWSARGPDAEAGTQVRIVRVDGTEVIVEPL